MYAIEKSPIDSRFGKYAWYYRHLKSVYYDAGFTNWKIFAYMKIFWTFLYFTIGTWVMKIAINQVMKHQSKLPNNEQVRKF